jgi:hypothetical protein
VEVNAGVGHQPAVDGGRYRPKNRFATAIVSMPANRISLINRSWKVLSNRSIRPLACGKMVT